MSATPTAPAAEAEAPSLREQLRAAVLETQAPAPAAPASPAAPAPPATDAPAPGAAGAPAPEAAPPATPPAPDPAQLARELAETRRVLDSVRGNVGQLAQERQRLLTELERARTAPHAERDRQVDEWLAGAEEQLKTIADPEQWKASRAYVDRVRADARAERTARDLAAREQALTQREQLLTFGHAQQLRGALPQVLDGYAEELAGRYGLDKDALKPYLHAPTTQRGIQAALGAINTFEDVRAYLTPTTDLLETFAATLAQQAGARAQAEAAQNREAARGEGAHRPEGGGASGAQPPKEIRTKAEIKAELRRRLTAGDFG